MAEPKPRQPDTEQAPDEQANPKQPRPASKGSPAEAVGSSDLSGQPARAELETGRPAVSSAGERKPAAARQPSGAQANGAPALPTADLLAASSEEFRDSLQTIRGALELLVAGKVPDQDKAGQFLKIAYRETGYLSHRVSDLHLAALIEADRLRLKLTTLSLEPLLDHLLQELAAPASDQEVSLEWDHDPGLPNFQADEALLRTALTNMLELSLRATPLQGSLQVRAASQQDRISVRIECRTRPKNGGTAGPDLRAADGQSLALYVARRIAQAHDGKLESSVPSREVQALELTLPLQPKARRRGRVLVVDDNPQAAFLLEYALQEEGYEPVKAMNGPDALKLARGERFDLIILDVLLPGIDGFEVCHRLRAAPETASIPVIMVSAKAREQDQSTALRIGADGYFSKPLGMAELMATIADLLEAGDSRGRHGD